MAASSPSCLRLFREAALLAATMAVLTTAARAEPSASDRAIAERLYDRGRAQMKDGQVAAACESFAESQRLDPATGTLLNLAACHEAQGKLASAWVELREALLALRRDNRPDRVHYARERLSAIEPRLAYLTIVLADPTSATAPVITLDGRALGPAAWGVAIPVDAGHHEALARWGEDAVWRETIDIKDGERRQLEVSAPRPPVHPATTPAAAAMPAATSAPPAASPTPPAGPAGQDAAPAAAGAHGRPRALPLALAATGLAAVGVGSYFGLKAADLWRQRNQACPMDACSTQGAALGSRAESAATAATWSFAGGAAALGAAALLFFWPEPPKSAGDASRARVPSWARVLRAVRVDARGGVGLGGTF